MHNFNTFFRIRFALAITAISLATAGCEQADQPQQASGDQAQADQASIGEQAATGDSSGAVPTVDLVVTDFAIHGPEEIGSGWTNFRLTNEGQQTHFVIFYRMPEGKTIEDQKREVVPAFEEVMHALRSGEIEQAQIGEFLGERVPDWAFTVQYRGGPGLLAPGRTTETAIHLDEPGTYLMECYVKMPDGTFHTTMGMLKEIQVSAENTGASEPEADFEVILSNNGIEPAGPLSAGSHVIRVNFTEDPPEAFMPYDVHLARLEENTDMQALVDWMDWSNVGGMRAPAPVEFLGGAENTPAGYSAYIKAELQPGRYVWISEINAEQMHHEFMVE